MWLEYVRCAGDEERLLDCPSDVDIGFSDCEHSEDVGVRCYGERGVDTPRVCMCCVCVFGQQRCSSVGFIQCSMCAIYLMFFHAIQTQTCTYISLFRSQTLTSVPLTTESVITTVPTSYLDTCAHVTPGFSWAAMDTPAMVIF